MEKGKNLHRLVYWYGYDNSRAFSIISAIQPKILSYEEGVEKHLHKIPPEIQSKVNKKQKVTKKEMLIISNLKAGEEEYALPLRNRSLWLHKFKEEHELESDNEHHDGSQLNESSGCDDENEEDSVHDNSQQDDDYNGKGPLQDDQLLSSDSSFRDDVSSEEEEEKDDDDEQDEQQKHNFTDSSSTRSQSTRSLSTRSQSTKLSSTRSSSTRSSSARSSANRLSSINSSSRLADPKNTSSIPIIKELSSEAKALLKLPSIKPNCERERMDRQTLHNAIWMTNYRDLEEHRRKFGHILVSRRYNNTQTLYEWVQNQRRKYKSFILSDAQIELLDRLGFNWYGFLHKGKRREDDETLMKNKATCVLHDDTKERKAVPQSKRKFEEEKTKLSSNRKRKRKKEQNSPSTEASSRDALSKAKSRFEEGKKKILSSLPKEVTQDFRKVCFAKWNGQYQCVLQLSPYDIPPGAVREQWMRMYHEVS